VATAESHNVFAQLVGRKRVLLWPPSALPTLHLYPAVHAAYRQSQIPLRAAAGASKGLGRSIADRMMEAYPLASRSLRAVDAASAGTAASVAVLQPGQDEPRGEAAGEASVVEGASAPPPLVEASDEGAVSVELAPGECLYIPPYWAHAVLSVDASVSLAAFSTSWEQARWSRSGWLAAPLGRFSGSRCARARGVTLLLAAFLRVLLPSLPPPQPSSPRQFLARLYAARFQPLFGSLAESHPRAAPPPAVELAACLSAQPTDGEADAELRRRVVEFAASLAALLTQPDREWGGRRFESGIVAELAADYVEELLGWPSGAEDVAVMLQLLATPGVTDGEPRRGVAAELE